MMEIMVYNKRRCGLLWKLWDGREAVGHDGNWDGREGVGYDGNCEMWRECWWYKGRCGRERNVKEKKKLQE